MKPFPQKDSVFLKSLLGKQIKFNTKELFKEKEFTRMGVVRFIRYNELQIGGTWYNKKNIIEYEEITETE